MSRTEATPQCPRCRAENPPDSLFCTECGARIEAGCPACGAENPPGARFCHRCGERLEGATAGDSTASHPSPRDYTPKHLAEKILQEKSALEGERKQVTVLFADVKGSMDLAEQIDPEEWHRILNRFFEILTDGVHRFEGTVNQYTGDGVMALFGAPIAHEDHAQRACYAALHLRQQLRSYGEELERTRGLEFSVRMGLNSGEVVVGKIGDDLRMDYTAQGHTVGLAARMQQIAEPGRICLTGHTGRLVEGFFRLGDLGRFELKGVRESLQVCELQDAGPLRRRLEVSSRHGLVRFIGRQGEMEQLCRAWEAAEVGRGQIAAVVGEAGVGKSRLVYEFKAQLGRQYRVLEALSVSHGKASAYLPLIELLKSYFRITLADDEQQRREKITGKVLTLDRTLEDALPYLFSLLGIADPTAALAQMDPETRRRRTLEVVKRVLVRETLEQPCVVIFEDLQWIDAETQAFLDVMSESVATARLLLLADYRPEYQHTWGSRTYYTQVRLDPLGEQEARELLAALLGKAISAEREVLEPVILEKTEGNPFFMEEVVQTLAEEGVLAGDRGSYRLEKAPSELHIPATVQGVLAARIDRLPAQEKELLQALSVMGKEIPYGLLRKVVGRSEEELYRLLSHLQAGEFIYEQPAFPEPEYTFKHALTQEVAYHSVLVDRRKILHEQTARGVEELYHSTLAEHYSELAHHYSRTDNAAKAIEYLQLAGQQAVERSAYREAIRQLTGALQLLDTLPKTRERNQQELHLQVALGLALTTTRGWAAPEVEEAYSRARDLCREEGETSPLFVVLCGLLAVHITRAELHEARELGSQILSLAQSAGDASFLLIAHLGQGANLQYLGELPSARAHLEQAIALYDPKQHHSLSSTYGGYDPGVASLSFAASGLWDLGYPDRALERSQEALTLAEELDHPFSTAFALTLAAFLHQLREETQATREIAEAVIALSDEHGFPHWLAWGTIARGRALANQGRWEEGIAQTRQGLDILPPTWGEANRPGGLASLAWMYGQVGQPEEGLVLIHEAMDVVNQTDQRQGESALHCVEGELLLAISHDDHAGAERCFRRGVDIARAQSAKSWELRAATRLARLWQGQGRNEEARELLAPVYNWFTEGFDTQDLKDARALLEELS